MIIAIFFALRSIWNSGAIQSILSPIYNTLGTMVIILIGIGILLTAVGVKVFHGMGTRLVQAAGHVARFVFVTLLWDILITGIFRITARVFRQSRNWLNSRNLNNSAATLIAVFIAALALIVII